MNPDEQGSPKRLSDVAAEVTRLIFTMKLGVIRVPPYVGCYFFNRLLGPGENDFPGCLLVPLLEFVNGFDHFRQVEFVRFEASADGIEQRNGKLAAEVFAKFLEALQDHQVIFRIRVE